MIDLTHHAKLKQLARNLHIPDSGDCLRELRDHAIASVQQIAEGVECRDDRRTTFPGCRQVVGENRVHHLKIRTPNVWRKSMAKLWVAFVISSGRSSSRAITEGLLIDNPKPGKGGRDYLVIVDARGSRKVRAYFTAWHELAHLLLYPRRQAVFDGFRRTPTLRSEVEGPRRVRGRSHCRTIGILGAAIQTRSPQCRFPAIFLLRPSSAPAQRLHQALAFNRACLSAVRIWRRPTAFVTAAVSRKSDGTSPSLRVQSIVANDAAREIGCRSEETNARTGGLGDIQGIWRYIRHAVLRDGEPGRLAGIGARVPFCA